MYEEEVDAEFLMESTEEPTVPTGLLELHVELEVAGITAREFYVAFSNS